METWSRVLRREVRRSARVAIVGVGHIARGDDAAGVLVVRSLLAATGPLPDKALIIEAEEAPENFTGAIRAFAPDLTVVIDAARAGRRPGTIFSINPHDVADEDLSTHRIPLGRLARFIQETMDCRVLLIGIEPAWFEGHRDGELAPPVRLAVRTVADVLRRALVIDQGPGHAPVRSSSASGRRCS